MGHVADCFQFRRRVICGILAIKSLSIARLRLGAFGFVQQFNNVPEFRTHPEIKDLETSNVSLPREKQMVHWKIPSP